MEDRVIRAAWTGNGRGAGELDAEHEIYHDDVVVEYPQSGERICGRRNIQALRGHHPSELRCTIRRVIGCGDLWVSEYVINYDGRPSTRSASWSSAKVKSHVRHSTSRIYSSPLPGGLSGLSR